MSIVTISLIVIVTLPAGMEGVLDKFQFHQPLVVHTLIGAVSGHMKEGTILGGSPQMMALGWTNVGVVTAPDTTLASVALATIVVLRLQGEATDINSTTSTSIAVAIPLPIADLFLTMICHTIVIPMVHFMDTAAGKGDTRMMEAWQMFAILLQSVRIATPAAALCVVSPGVVTNVLSQMPSWLSGGMAVGGGMVAAVGYAMVINMMATKKTWLFLALGFVLAASNQLTPIALGITGIIITLVYLGPKEHGGSNNGGGSSNTGGPLGDILNGY